MFINTVIFITAVVSFALIWRALLLDHETLLNYVTRIPLIGAALACGFCSAVWFTAIGVLIFNPLLPQFNNSSMYTAYVISWLSLSAGVLLLRNLITVLMEGTGVLTHLHRDGHK